MSLSARDHQQFLSILNRYLAQVVVQRLQIFLLLSIKPIIQAFVHAAHALCSNKFQLPSSTHPLALAYGLAILTLLGCLT